MVTNIRYILLTALRDFLFLGLIIAVILAVSVSATLGGMAMVETEAMTLVFSAGSARIILMLGLIVFIAFHVRQAFDQKEIDILLSRPISRFQIMFSYWLGFSLVAFLLGLATITILSFQPIIEMQGFLYWSVSLMLESFLIVAVALFTSFTLSSAVSSVMSAMGIYVISRMMAFFVATSESQALFRESWVNEMLRFLIETVSLVLPRLDVFTQSEWLVYGVTRMQDVEIGIIQILIYVPLLIVAATIDFQRREF